MKILALETSAKAVSAAICQEDTVCASAFQDTGLTHSRTLMPLVELLMRNTGMRLQEMDGIAVAAGPGSFTGIRIGVAAAKGLAIAADKPLCGVSTLAGMARLALPFNGLVVCCMDARRAQIYNALFRAGSDGLERLSSDRAIDLEDLAKELAAEQAPILCIGDGAILTHSALSKQGISCMLAPPSCRQQSAVGVAFEALAAGSFFPAQQLQPFYLRPPQAVRLKERMHSEQKTYGTHRSVL